MGKVKSDLKDLGGSAGQAGDAMDYSMLKARGGLMIVESELGVHLPRALNTLIATIPGVGFAFSAMLPIIGVVAAVAIIEKLIQKQKELQDASSAAWGNLAGDTADALHKMDEELLESAAKIDDLNGNHVAALQKRLKLLDDQKLDKLSEEFTKLAKETDVILGGMKASWYEALQGKGDGVDEVKQQFDTLQARLAELKNAGNDKGFGDALSGGLKAALARVDELNLHTSAFHKEERAALAAELEALVDQTQEYEKQSQITKNAKTAETLQDEDKWAIKLRRDHGELRKAREDAAKEAERENEDIANSIKAVADLMAESARKEAQENIKISESYDAIAQARAKANAESQRSSISTQADLGLITKQQEAQKLLAIDQQELKDFQKTEDAKLQALKDFATQSAQVAQQSKGTNQEEATRNTAAQAQIAYNEAVAKSITETQQLNDKIAQQQAAAAKLGATWKTYFAQMKTETSDLATTINTTLQGSMTKFIDGFAQGIAKTIADGKNFGKEMKGVARDILEGMIQTLVKWVAQWIVSHTIMAAVGNSSALQQVATQKVLAAQLAGANAVASFSAAPWPIDMGAPAFGASMMAAAMSFEIGGKIPGAGAVPIIGHGGETVVTKALTDRVESAEHGGSGSGMRMHATFAPHIHAVDAEGVDRMLEKHGAVFHRHIASTLRKMNK
jgi:hypothetical protein